MSDENESDEVATSSADWREAPGLIARGASMGMAEVIPGVSGGTLALITGIYTRFIDAIKSVDGEVVKCLLSFKWGRVFGRVHWRFLAMVGLGQLLGIAFCTKVIELPQLLKSHPEPVLGLFFGLIIGSAILMARDAGAPDAKGIAAYVVGGIIGWLVVTSVPSETPESPWFVFLCGVVAICSWILPGISGSYVLLLLKKYDYVWAALTMHNDASFTDNLLHVALPFVLGALIGIATFSRVLSWVLHHYQKTTMMAMNGLLIVSLYAIWPFQNRVMQIMASGKEKMVSSTPYWPGPDKTMTWSHSFAQLALCLAVVGVVAVLAIDFLARKKQASATNSTADIDRP